VVFKLKWKEAAAVGFASFFLPFLACAAAAHYLLGWRSCRAGSPVWRCRRRRSPSSMP
jgi:hypothetical protein